MRAEREANWAARVRGFVWDLLVIGACMAVVLTAMVMVGDVLGLTPWLGAQNGPWLNRVMLLLAWDVAAAGALGLALATLAFWVVVAAPDANHLVHRLTMLLVELPVGHRLVASTRARAAVLLLCIAAASTYVLLLGRGWAAQINAAQAMYRGRYRGG